jgi:hypothetical protein
MNHRARASKAGRRLRTLLLPARPAPADTPHDGSEDAQEWPDRYPPWLVPDHR